MSQFLLFTLFASNFFTEKCISITLNESCCNCQQFCIIYVLFMIHLLHFRSNNRRNWHVNSGAEWCSVIVDQYNVVAVKFWHFWLLNLLQTDQNAFLLFTFDGDQNSVTDHSNASFVVNMNYTGRFTFGHRLLSDFTVVDDSEASQFSNF